jgi:hypothetical protein
LATHRPARCALHTQARTHARTHTHTSTHTRTCMRTRTHLSNEAVALRLDPVVCRHARHYRHVQDLLLEHVQCRDGDAQEAGQLGGGGGREVQRAHAGAWHGAWHGARMGMAHGPPPALPRPPSPPTARVTCRAHVWRVTRQSQSAHSHDGNSTNTLRLSRLLTPEPMRMSQVPQPIATWVTRWPQARLQGTRQRTRVCTKVWDKVLRTAPWHRAERPIQQEQARARTQDARTHRRGRERASVSGAHAHGARRVLKLPDSALT